MDKDRLQFMELFSYLSTNDCLAHINYIYMLASVSLTIMSSLYGERGLLRVLSTIKCLHTLENFPLLTFITHLNGLEPYLNCGISCRVFFFSQKKLLPLVIKFYK